MSTPALIAWGAVVVGAARHLAVGVPVADDEAVKAHPGLQHAGQKALVPVQLDALPTGEGGHHRHHARVDGRDVARGVQTGELALAVLVVALVLAVRGPAVAQEVLGRSRHAAVLQRRPCAGRALQAGHQLSGIGGDDLRVLGIAFVGAAPAVVAHHGQGRPEAPVDPDGGGLAGGRLADPAHQGRVVHGAQADVVREEGRAHDIVVPVHGVDAEDDRDRRAARAGFQRGGAKGPRCGQPGRSRRAVRRIQRRAVAAGQDRAQRIVAKVLRLDAGDVGLDQLSDLLLQAHAPHQLSDEGFGPVVDQPRAVGRGPGLRMGDAWGFGGVGRVQSQGRRWRRTPSRERSGGLPRPAPPGAGRAGLRRKKARRLGRRASQGTL